MNYRLFLSIQTIVFTFLVSSIGYALETKHSPLGDSSATIPDNYGLLEPQDLYYPIVSQRVCQNDSLELFQCEVPEITLIEKRQSLPDVPYQTEITVSRSNCYSRFQNQGNLQLEIHSLSGEFLKYETLDYLSSTRTFVSIPGDDPIGTVFITPKNPNFFQKNQFPLSCEMSLLVEMNVPIAKSKEDALKIKLWLEEEYQKVKDQADLLKIFHEIYNYQRERDNTLQTGVLSEFDSRENNFDFLDLVLNQLEVLIRDETGKIDSQTKLLFASATKVLKISKTESNRKTQLEGDFLHFLSKTDLKLLQNVSDRILQMMGSDSLYQQQETFRFETNRFEKALESLDVFDDLDFEKPS